MYANTPTYGNTMTPITQSALPQPDISSRRNRSPKTDIANQNQSTKANRVSTSMKKLAKLKPPANNMGHPLRQLLLFGKVTECQAVCALAKLTARQANSGAEESAL